MLFILTGQVQTGKTRWLSKLVDRLGEEDVSCYGVLTPGIWKRKDTAYEKLGIEAVLLPQNQIIPFAQRDDLVLPERRKPNQSSARGLRWCIDEDALQAINEHFNALQSKVDSPDTASKLHKKGLLLIDELGKLELEGKPGGLISALNLLGKGPTKFYKHALIVVRSSLYCEAASRYKASWKDVQPLHPTEVDAQTFLHIVGATV